MPSNDPDITPLYYLDNFRYLITFVAARYHNLLNAREKIFLTRFSDLPLSAQALYVRLLQRKGPYFKEKALISGSIKFVTQKYLQ